MKIRRNHTDCSWLKCMLLRGFALIQIAIYYLGLFFSKDIQCLLIFILPGQWSLLL